MRSNLSFVLTCGFFFLGGILLLFSINDILSTIGIFSLILGGVPLLVFWWNGFANSIDSFRSKEESDDEQS